MTQRYCGLDFGTSNSTIGVGDIGQHFLCPLEGNSVTLPSAVFFNYEDDTVAYGRHAVASYIEGSQGRLLRALKSVLGSSLMSETTQIKHRRVSLSEIIGMFIRQLKDIAERHIGDDVDSVVLGRPVRFVDDDDIADRDAENELVNIVRSQGFRHIELQYEPVAAALHYELSLEREELAMIVDLGGGTSDFVIARLLPARSHSADRSGDILGRSGVHIGGTDFDRLLSIARVMPEMGLNVRIGLKKMPMPIWLYQDLATWHRIPSLYSAENVRYLRLTRSTAEEPELIDRLIEILVKRDGHRLAVNVESAKMDLSGKHSAEIQLPLKTPVKVPVLRSQFEDAISKGLDKIGQGVEDCLKMAGVPAERVQAVFLTGGSTAIPVVRQQILAHLPAAKPVSGDVFGSVGIGLAIDAGRKFGGPSKRFS